MQASCWKTSMLCLWFSWVSYQLVLYGFLITHRFQMLFPSTGRFFKIFCIAYSKQSKTLNKNDWSGNSGNVYAWNCCRSYFSSDLCFFIKENRRRGSSGSLRQRPIRTEIDIIGYFFAENRFPIHSNRKMTRSKTDFVFSVSKLLIFQPKSFFSVSLFYYRKNSFLISVLVGRWPDWVSWIPYQSD